MISWFLTLEKLYYKQSGSWIYDEFKLSLYLKSILIQSTNGAIISKQFSLNNNLWI